MANERSGFTDQTQELYKGFLMRNSGSNFISVVQPGSKAYQRYIKRNSIYYPHWLIDNRMPLRIAKNVHPCYWRYILYI